MGRELYAIACTVSGGVTGTRHALYKSNGETQFYASVEVAARVARELQERADSRPSNGAVFQYMPIRLEHGGDCGTGLG